MTVRYPLITFDAYAALADYRSTLLPVVGSTLDLEKETAADFLELWRTRQLGVAALSNALGRGRISFRECTALALDYAIRRYELAVDSATCDELVRAWYPLVPWPEADEVLAALKSKGYTLAILSNGDRDMLEALAGQLETPFDRIFSTEACGYYKPHRELGIDEYLHVAGSGNDAVGAKAAGVDCYWSNRLGDIVLLPDYTPDREGTSLSGLLEVL